MRVLIAAATAAALLTGCAGGATTATGRTIDIEMREFSFSPSTIRLAPGERVTLRLKNSGTVEHDGPPVRLMTAIAFLVGTLVVGLVLYSATVERQREYGVLKAVGAPARTLYGTTLTQAAIVTAAGAVLGLGLAIGEAQLVMALRPQFLVMFEPGTVATGLAASALMAILAVFLPARVIAGLAPADVFRR